MIDSTLCICATTVACLFIICETLIRIIKINKNLNGKVVK